MKRLLAVLFIFVIMMAVYGCSAKQLAASKAVEQAAYKFNPIAGAGMQVFNLLASAFSSPPEDQLGDRKSYASCSYSIRDIKEWQTISEPVGVKKIPNGTETLWYQSGDAFFQVACFPKSSTMEQWGQATLNSLSGSFGQFELLGQASFEFKGVPAHWFAYKAVPKGFTEEIRGYMIIVDRGSAGMSISLAVPTAKYETHAPLFQIAIQSVELN